MLFHLLNLSFVKIPKFLGVVLRRSCKIRQINRQIYVESKSVHVSLFACFQESSSKGRTDVGDNMASWTTPSSSPPVVVMTVGFLPSTTTVSLFACFQESGVRGNLLQMALRKKSSNEKALPQWELFIINVYLEKTSKKAQNELYHCGCSKTFGT